MFILHGDNWEDSILDYYRPPGQLMIAVTAWAVVRPIKGMYLVRARNWGMLREYLGEFGLKAVIRKVRSRLGEGRRNEKYISVGLGRIITSDEKNGWEKGSPVIFLAPSHPGCVERIVLHPDLVRMTTPEIINSHTATGGITIYGDGPSLPDLNDIVGWQPESGCTLPEEQLNKIFSAIADYWAETPGSSRILPLAEPSVIATSSRSLRATDPQPQFNAVLYGLGNYAKTQIIPNLLPAIKITAIHEVDPTQISRQNRKEYEFSTAPEGEENSRYDIHFIAGYHHTHAGLAIRALDQGATAAVEKPVVTTREQLAELLAVLRSTGGRLYSCFQMRYNPLFELARQDLDLSQGDPVHITADVYEIPIPLYHWYNWPNSGSHLVSNGCHWLDHFLFMNDFSRPVSQTVNRLSNGDTVVTVELTNGACLVLHLTHIGSPRIGVQDHVVMRREDRTVTVVNGSRYLAEAGPRKIRREKINKMDVYRGMYREISRKIITGEGGDSIESIEITNTLMLDLEEELERKINPKL